MIIKRDYIKEQVVLTCSPEEWHEIRAAILGSALEYYVNSMETRETFSQAKSLAETLADSDGIKYGITYWAGIYGILSEHEPLFKLCINLKSDVLVEVIEPENKEDIYRRALEQIAYTAEWPQELKDTKEMPVGDYAADIWDLRNWMQSVAANALTNGGKNGNTD